MIRILLLCLLSILSINLCASDFLRCLAVDSIGGVELFYLSPNEELYVNVQHEIYFSKQLSGPYMLIDSFSDQQINYYHQNSDADNSISYYYILFYVESFSGNYDSLYSDTLSTIFMNATSINLGLSANLSWNPVSYPSPSSSSLVYELNYNNEENSNITIDNIFNLYYQIDIDNCEYNSELYVKILDSSGCMSKSSIAYVYLQDTVSPSIPKIKTVSVDNLGNAVISWEPSYGADNYIIYYQDSNGAWITLDTVSSNSDSYTYQNSLADIEYESFSIRSIDSCGNSRLRSVIHNSLYLSDSINICDNSILLNWNKYINWDGGVSHYNLLIFESNANGNITDTIVRLETQTQYLINNLSSSSTYNVIIEAYNNDSTLQVFSNKLNLNIKKDNYPMFNYIEYVSINNDDGSIDLSCIVDISAVIDRYDIYRSLEQDEFYKIAEVDFTSISPIYFNDKDVIVNDYFYSYKVIPIDSCGVGLFAPSVNIPEYLEDTSFAQTILLNVGVNIDYNIIPENVPNNIESLMYSDFNINYTNTLDFNKYQKWLGDVSEYRLFRSIDDEPFNTTPIYIWDRLSDPEKELSYIDFVSPFFERNGRFCYYLEAVEGYSNPYNTSPSISSSNIICVNQPPIFFIPSAFTPNNDNLNDVFKPITYFVSQIEYSLSLYNKLGEKIFYTNNPKASWDGMHNSLPVQNGSYIYHIQFLNNFGELDEIIDIINLIR